MANKTIVNEGINTITYMYMSGIYIERHTIKTTIKNV